MKMSNMSNTKMYTHMRGGLPCQFSVGIIRSNNNACK